MIKKFEDFKTELRENMRGGDGTVTVTSFVSAEELNEMQAAFGPGTTVVNILTGATVTV